METNYHIHEKDRTSHFFYLDKGMGIYYSIYNNLDVELFAFKIKESLIGEFENEFKENISGAIRTAHSESEYTHIIERAPITNSIIFLASLSLANKEALGMKLYYYIESILEDFDKV